MATKLIILLFNIQLSSRCGDPERKSLRCFVPNKSRFFTAVHVYNVLLSRGLLGVFSS